MNQELLEQIAENLVSLAEQVKGASVEASHTVQLPLQDVGLVILRLHWLHSNPG